MVEIILIVILILVLSTSLLLKKRISSSSELVIYEENTIRAFLFRLIMELNIKRAAVVIVTCLSVAILFSSYKDFNEIKEHEELIVELKMSYLRNGYIQLYLYGSDLTELDNSDYRILNNELTETYGIERIWAQDLNRPYYEMVDRKNIDRLIYNSFFENDSLYGFSYILENNLLSKALQTIFGNGFWTHSGIISLEVPNLVYSYDISVEAPDILELGEEEFKPIPRTYLSQLLRDNGRLNENTTNQVQNIFHYGIKLGNPYSKEHLKLWCVNSDENKIATEPNIDFKVSGRKNHQVSTIVQYNKECLTGLNGNVISTTYYSSSSGAPFELKCSAELHHGINSFYLVNYENGIRSAHPLGSVWYDAEGPEIEIDYNVYGSGVPDNPKIDGSAIIKCHSWQGLYKPMTVKLKGDIERLYIDGKRFLFNSSDNPQEIYRRVPVNDFFGHNRVEVIAYDKRGNRTMTYWEFEAVAVD